MKCKLYKFIFKAILMVIMLVISMLPSYSQTAPGGVSSGLRTWYKADAITPVPTGTDISSWDDQATADGIQNATQSSANVSTVFGNRKPQYRTAAAKYNFNPYLDFNKSYSSLRAYKAHSNTGDYTFSYTKGATLYQVGDLTNTNNEHVGTSLGSSGAISGGVRYEYGYGIYPANYHYNGIAVGYYQNTVNDYSYNSSNPARKINKDVPWINAVSYDKYGTNNGVYQTTLDSKTAIQTRKDGSKWSWGYNYTPAGPSLYIGNELTNYNAGRWWKGNIPEVILYDRKLTTNEGGEADRVDTYLALKYGITLKHNYYISNGTKVWDTVCNKTFNEQIAGLARDNASGLHQKQSKSIYNSSIVTMSAGNVVEYDNSLNTSVIPEKYTLMWGSNKVTGDFINGGTIPGGYSNFVTAVGGVGPGINANNVCYTMKKWLVQEQAGKDAGTVKVYIESRDIAAIDWTLSTWIMVGTDASFSNPRFYPLALANATAGSPTDYMADINFCEGAPNASSVLGGIKYQYFAIVGVKRPFLPGGVDGFTVWCRADFGVYSDSLLDEDAEAANKVQEWVNLAGTRNAFSDESSTVTSPLFRAATVYDNFNPMVDFSASLFPGKGVGMYLLDVNKYTGTTPATLKYNTFYGFSSNRAVNGGQQVISTISATNYNSPGVYPQLANNATGSGNYLNNGFTSDGGYSLGRASFKKNENIIATSYADTTGTYIGGVPYINQSNWRNGRDSATLSSAAITSNNAPATQSVSNQNQYFTAALGSYYDYTPGLGFRPEHTTIGYYRGNKSGARDNYGATPYNWCYSATYPVATVLQQDTGTYIHEVISYQRKLTKNERERVETYLGIRNGSTVYHNYLATNSAVIFDTSYTDATPNGGAPNNRYTYSITGIGRDDTEKLYQKVSRNCLDTLLTISLGFIPADGNNKSVDAYFKTDREYIIWGSNGGNQNVRSTSDIPVAAGCLDSRLNREYRIQLTGDSTGTYGTQVRWQLDNNILDTVALSTLQLIIDEDGDGNFQTGPARFIAAANYNATTNTVIFDNVSWSSSGDPQAANAAMTIGWNSAVKSAALYGAPGAGNEGGGCTSCDDPDYNAALICTSLTGNSLYGNTLTKKIYATINWGANTSNCPTATVVIKSNTANASRRISSLNTGIGGSNIDSAAVLSARLYQVTKNASCTISQPIRVRIYYDSVEIVTDSAWLNGGGANLNEPITTDSSGLVWFAYDGNINDVLSSFTASGLPVGDAPGKALALTPDKIGVEDGIKYVEFVIEKPSVTIGWMQRKTKISNFPFFKAKVLLQGALPGSAGSVMNDDLRIGFANSGIVIPRAQPYNVPAFGNYAGVDSVAAADSAARFANMNNNSVVDWILLEFRDQNNPADILSRRALLVQRDGDIIDPETGSDSIYIGETGISLDNYYVSVRHRNHLGVMFANSIDFKAAAGAMLDFTDLSKDLYNKTPEYDGYEAAQISGKWVLWGGDANSDGKVKMSLFNNDQAIINNSVVNHVLNPAHASTFTSNGYYDTDVNMNGQIKVSLLGNDQATLTNYILFNVRNPGHDPLFILVQQLP